MFCYSFPSENRGVEEAARVVVGGLGERGAPLGRFCFTCIELDVFLLAEDGRKGRGRAAEASCSVDVAELIAGVAGCPSCCAG